MVISRFLLWVGIVGLEHVYMGREDSSLKTRVAIHPGASDADRCLTSEHVSYSG